MIRKTIFAALVLLVSVPAFAQTAKPADAKADFTDEVVYDENPYRVVTNPFWNNWFISVGGGVQFYFGDHELQLNFKELVSPAIDVAVGKWFSPEIGARLMYSGFALRGATQSGVHSLGTPIESQPWDGKWLENSRFGFYNIHADVLFNLSNIIGGYKTRVYNISPYVGLGVIGTRQEPKTTEVAVNGGIMNTFRVCPALDVNLDIRGLVTSDNFDGEVGGRSGEGLLVATVGITYKFKERGWERPKTVFRHDNREANGLRNQIEALKAENARLQDALAAAENDKDVETIIKEINVASPVMITFNIGKSKLAKRDRASLSLMADLIKESDESIVYTITGYADAGTGSAERNEVLSRERAEAVYNCLVEEYGVPADRLKVENKVSEENMFYDDPALSRAAITVGRRK